ncbi:MAG: hypothetical protein RIC55_16795 [Pirellulaceae bacterium]
MSHENTKPLDGLEAALASLTPTGAHAAGRADRDRLMYLAGRASAECSAAPRRTFSVIAWPLTTAAMALVALSLGLLLARERHLHHELLAAEAQRQERRPQHNAPAAPEEQMIPHKTSPHETSPHETSPHVAAPPTLADGAAQQGSAMVSYLQLRSRVLAEGVDALPIRSDAVPQDAQSPLTPRSPLQLLDG